MTENKSGFKEARTMPRNKESLVPRRKFLAYAGLSTSVLALGSCKKIVEEIKDYTKDHDGMGGNSVNLGSGDIGILNYAYALEQLEAAFYTKVSQHFYNNISSKEQSYLEGIRDHEIAHREFFKKALGDKAIGTLEVDFSTINFASRDSVLSTAKAFEDLGVSAYNGAGELLENADYLLLAGKIVSVEARHASAIRDLLSYGSFVDNTAVNEMGLDLYRTPPQVLQIAGTYLKTKINASNLPTS
jgi:rubrerythrin